MDFDDEVSDDENPEVAETRALIERLTPKKDKPKSKSATTTSAARKDIFSDEAGSQDPINVDEPPSKKAASRKVTEKKKETAKSTKPTATKSKKQDSKQAKLSFASKAKKQVRVVG